METSILLDVVSPPNRERSTKCPTGMPSEREHLSDLDCNAARLTDHVRLCRRDTSFNLIPELLQTLPRNTRRFNLSSENEPPAPRSLSYGFGSKMPLCRLFDGASESEDDVSQEQGAKCLEERDDDLIDLHHEDLCSTAPPTPAAEEAKAFLGSPREQKRWEDPANLRSADEPWWGRPKTSRQHILLEPLEHVALSASRPRHRLGLRPSPWTIRSADRFVFQRRPGVESRNSLKVSRPASRLTPTERQLRRRTGFSDPFGPQSSRSNSNSLWLSDRLLHSPPFHAAGFLATRPDSESIFNSISSRIAGHTHFTSGRTPQRTSSAHVSDGRGNLLSSGSSARFITPKFLERKKPPENLDIYEKRLALALDINLTERVLQSKPSASAAVTVLSPPTLANACMPNTASPVSRTFWQDNEWKREGPLGILEAEGLRDDYYCSILAYSHAADRLAVGIGSKIYLWSEEQGLIHPPPQFDAAQPAQRPSHVTSVAFSSETCGNAILAVGRVDGRVLLWSPLDTEPRFLRLTLPHSASFVTFRPQPIKRVSQRHGSVTAENEVMLVGDDFGTVWVFLVEWPNEQERYLFGWEAGLVLHARISAHAQQICGVAWTTHGDAFATGGNDNLCCLFRFSCLFSPQPNPASQTIAMRRDSLGNYYMAIVQDEASCIIVGPEQARHRWRLTAAVKAMAFCPWQKGLIAAGGGSNDRCIHFYHTVSGACLATIDCAAQVTSLIWSATRREIAATLGFPQPEHPFRIVVYAWPSCEQIVAIPWHDEMRALYAIPYPGGADRKREAKHEPGPWWGRDTDQGSIVVAGSDSSIKFHEVWADDKRATASHGGLLGGSAILESLHGVEKEGRETIR